MGQQHEQKPRWLGTKYLWVNPFAPKPEELRAPRAIEVLFWLIILLLPVMLDVGFDREKCIVLWEGERQITQEEYDKKSSPLGQCIVEGFGSSRFRSIGTQDGIEYYLLREVGLVPIHFGVVGTDIPIATLMYLVATYLGKFYAENLAIGRNYGPYALETKKSKHQNEWLRPQLLQFWVRNSIDAVPPTEFITGTWWLGLLLSIWIDIFIVSGWPYPIVAVSFLLAGVFGKDYSERQLMDEKYGY